MTKTEAIEVLKFNMDMCRFNPMTGEETPMSKDAEELADACEIAIKCIKSTMHMTPRWKTYKSNKEFWNAIDAWMHDENNIGKNMDDLTAYLLEEVDISEDC